MANHVSVLDGRTSTWRKSTRSSANQTACVEVRLFEGDMQVRDTKLDDSPILDVTSHDWRGFLAEFGK
jgi:Domain of unknown function (DUF397)